MIKNQIYGKGQNEIKQFSSKVNWRLTHLPSNIPTREITALKEKVPCKLFSRFYRPYAIHRPDENCISLLICTRACRIKQIQHSIPEDYLVKGKCNDRFYGKGMGGGACQLFHSPSSSLKYSWRIRMDSIVAWNKIQLRARIPIVRPIFHDRVV